MSARGGHPHNRLTDLAVRQALPGRHADGNGLYLFVRRAGRLIRSWVQRLVVKGKRRDLGLGPYPLVPLAEARRVAAENRRVARAGGDPKAHRARTTTPTVRWVAGRVLEERRGDWRHEATAKKWIRMFDTWVFPEIGDTPISDVTVEDVRKILKPHWKGRGSLGYVLRQHLDRVFKWAIVRKHRTDNPAALVQELLHKAKRPVRHHPSLPYEDLPEAAAAIRAADVDPAVKLMVLFIVLTAARFGEAAGARWEEINGAKKLWVLPPERMKAQEEHVVPLSTQALELLDEVRALKRSASFVFRTSSGRPVSSIAVTRLLRSLGLVDAKGKPVVQHGFRTTFRGWAVTVAEAHREVCEAALAHAEGNKTVAAYLRTDYLKKRIPLMQRWADYVLPR